MSHVLDKSIILCVIVTVIVSKISDQLFCPSLPIALSPQSQGPPGNTGPKGQRGERVSLGFNLILFIIF